LPFFRTNTTRLAKLVGQRPAEKKPAASTAATISASAADGFSQRINGGPERFGILKKRG